MLSLFEHTLVAVHRAGDGRHLGEVDLSALTDVRCSDPDIEPDSVLHAYVALSDVVSGDLPVASHTDRSAKILVCVRRRYNTSATYSRLLERAESDTISTRSSQFLA